MRVREEAGDLWVGCEQSVLSPFQTCIRANREFSYTQHAVKCGRLSRHICIYIPQLLIHPHDTADALSSIFFSCRASDVKAKTVNI